MIYFILILELLFLGFTIFCLWIVKRKGIKVSSKFLRYFILVLSIIYTVLFLVVTIVQIIQSSSSFLIWVSIVNAFISFFFISCFLYYGYKMNRNLSKDLIFVEDNSICLLEMSKAIIYSVLASTIAGIAFFIIENVMISPNERISISMSTMDFVHLIIGMVFYIIHLMFDRAIEIYKENELTI